MRRGGVVDKAVGERMRELMLKAMQAQGVEMPRWKVTSPPNYRVFVCKLYPNAKSFHSAQIRLSKILRGLEYLSPKSRNYYHVCYVLGIDPYTAGYDTIDPARIIKPERVTVKRVARVKRLNSTSDLSKKIIWLSSQRFRWLAIRALKVRGITHKPETKAQTIRWEGFAQHIAPTGKAKSLLMHFFEGSAILTPQNALYWRLCRALDIPPQKAAFDYKIREGVDVDRL